MSHNQGYSWPLEFTVSKDGFEIKHQGQVVAREGMSRPRITQRPLIENGVFKGIVVSVPTSNNQK